LSNVLVQLRIASDMYKFYNYFEKLEGSGITGIYITIHFSLFQL